MSSQPTNPFQLEAVATYGDPLSTCENLEYMRRALGELNNYLMSYPDDHRRYGGAIGLAGGPGSGKTHLLSWLGDKARALTHIQAETIYGKADSDSLFDLYRETMGQVDRRSIIQLIDLAGRRLAAEQVGSAKVTQSLQTRIDAQEDLAELAKEGNIDPAELANVLEERLAATDVPSAIRRTLLAVSESGAGESAYRWLQGDDVRDLATLGLEHNLRETGGESAADATVELSAVHAWEALAALHRLAGKPLIVFIDQLEVLLRADPQKQQTLFSVLKKLIEHLGRQYALVFIAGSDEGWRKLPRDVNPRLRLRRPLKVGSLNLEEARELLDAYTQARTRFGDDELRVLVDLAGGNPREIVRIAFHEFNRHRGRLEESTTHNLLESAQDTGTVEDRATLALNIADSVLAEYGDVHNDLSVGSVTIDRLVKRDARPVVALMLVRATDQLSEAGSARYVHDVLAYMKKSWPETTLIVVPIGYASDEVRDLLEQTATVIPFDEPRFCGELETEMATISANAAPADTVRTAPDPAVLDLLERISRRIQKLEVNREKSSVEMQERFAASTKELARSAQEERELKTRWEMLEELDRLMQSLADGKLADERRLIRTVLVANETYLSDRNVDRLGALYLDVLDVVSLSREREPEVFQVELRSKILYELRACLRSMVLRRRMLQRPGVTTIQLGCATSIIVFGALFWMDLTYGPNVESLYYDLIRSGVFSLTIGFALAGSVMVFLSLLDPIRSLAASVRRLQNKSFESTTSD